MKRAGILLGFIFIISNLFSQNVGVGTTNPTNTLHIKPVNIGANPLKIEGLNTYNIGDTSILMINPTTGVVKYANTTDFIALLTSGGGISNDDQNIDSLTLVGTNLTTYIEDGNAASVDLSYIIDSAYSYVVANADTLFINSDFTDSIVSIMYHAADTLLYNSTFISDLRDSIDTDIDSVTLTGTVLTIYENGGGVFVDLSSLSDNDADPTNEIQHLSLTGNTLSISNGNSVTLTDNVNDADSDPNNEIQDLTLTGNTLSLTNDNTTVDLSGYLDNTDAQTLSLTGNTLSISNGNSVTLTDNVNDADSDPTNEIQSLTESNGVLSLSNGGGNVNVGTIVNAKVLIASGQNVTGPNASNNGATIDLSTYGFVASGPAPHIIVSQRNYNANSVDGNTMDASFCGFTKTSNLVFQTQCWVSPNSSSGVVRSSFDWIAIQILP
ncbi:MAG: hypothetical protein N4A35_03345 [Flavobacteriales bacterium]|jgi:hypothetical protein|nr:hypothetical protein [Flavobacteriales bacterium]